MSVAASDSAAPAQQARVELADVFARYADGYFDTHGATQAQRKVARAIVQCRTAALLRGLARLGSPSISLFSHHRLRYAILELIHPTIVCGSRDSFLKAELIDRQAARCETIEPFLPVQVVVQIASWPSHDVSPKSAVSQHSRIHDLASMDLADAYRLDEFSAF